MLIGYGSLSAQPDIPLAMYSDEFHTSVLEVAVRVHQACEGVHEDSGEQTDYLAQDLRELLSIGRDAASELILCSSVDEAIDRLKRDQRKLEVVDYLSCRALRNRDSDLAIHLAFVEKANDSTPSLPCVPFCSYLTVLCNELEGSKPPDGNVL